MLKPIHYSDAGVDRDKSQATLKNLSPLIEGTFSKAVLNPLGGFAALYDLKTLINDYEEPVLVQSVDGIGTKTIIARLMNQYHSLGYDLVAATANDILVYGAKPLTLLDYIASDVLDPQAIKDIVQGMAQACQQSNISLLGGETAEMPGIYQPGEYDLVGMITGVVEKKKLILGNTISPGDGVFAFSSSGLHSNGYSLARHLLFKEQKLNINAYRSDLDKTLGEALLEPHLNYTQAVLHLLDHQLPIKGMAHITGGGVIDNLPRILPKNCAIEIKKNTWPVPPIFSILQDLGRIEESELYRTFNMGIGYVLIADEPFLKQANELLVRNYPTYKLYPIGHVVEGTKEVHLCA